MRVVLSTYGSRGDVEPLVGLAARLQALDVEVRVCAPPDEEFVVDVNTLSHKNPVSAYAGRRLSGVVRRTWLRGAPVQPGGTPNGMFLERGRR